VYNLSIYQDLESFRICIPEIPSHCLVVKAVKRLCVMIREGRCCDFGKGTKLIRSGVGPSNLENARSGFVIFQFPSKNCQVDLGRTEA